MLPRGIASGEISAGIFLQPVSEFIVGEPETPAALRLTSLAGQFLLEAGQGLRNRFKFHERLGEC